MTEHDTDIDYDALYRDTADSGGPPWDIGAPQPALEKLLDDAVPGPAVLDLGCGAGDLAIALARRGHDVTAVDKSGVAIEAARAKAAAEGLTIHFETQDATRLHLRSAPFDTVFDSGLLHSLDRQGGDNAQRYLSLLPGLAAPGATVFVLAVSPQAGQGWGLTEEYLRASFAEPTWTGTRIEEIDVAAETDGRQLTLSGYLLRTTAPHRLATYGTLAPGRPNHHHLADLHGRWLTGEVHGRLVEAGWGADLGYPALIPDPAGPAVPVQVLESADLPAHWSRLDEFEGPGYRRVTTTVSTAHGDVTASIYVLRERDG
ncbi:methyltransferase domain-containing protein [Jidongwangia harbinensis]|uniref:methyltransferase domain-containing protein n=1 Tax=Jidongwangia harbinensis TaxID=2878561 RepID=UPI001CD9FD8D|nr:methyltransferase domain-containing protein [Jidongwangia harbinensis]MCA2213010.1 methyltransferase domain-containing protein [Jidongwangia harbinensis]